MATTNYHAAYFNLDRWCWCTGGEHENLEDARDAVRHADVWHITDDDGTIIEECDGSEGTIAS